MFQETVTNKDGNQKTVMASTLEELEAAVRMAKGDQLPVSPDINNPDHGNVVVKDFEASSKKVVDKKAKS